MNDSINAILLALMMLLAALSALAIAARDASAVDAGPHATRSDAAVAVIRDYRE